MPNHIPTFQTNLWRSNIVTQKSMATTFPSFQQSPTHIEYNQWVILHLKFTTQVEDYIKSKRVCNINIPIPMWILAKCQHGWLGGQEVSRSSQTTHLALETRFFDYQVASWLLPGLPLWSPISPWSLAAEPASFEAHFGWFVAQCGWTELGRAARPPQARCMRMMYLNYLA